MQRWEYTAITRRRAWEKDPGTRNASWAIASKWEPDIAPMLEKLGNEGWELVAVSPRSRYLGGFQLGQRQTYSDNIDYAGFTSEEMWVFKRPKNEV